MKDKKDDRPSPVRQTRKSLYILEKVRVINDGKINKSKEIEKALSEQYPLFSEMFDKESKK